MAILFVTPYVMPGMIRHFHFFRFFVSGMIYLFRNSYSYTISRTVVAYERRLAKSVTPSEPQPLRPRL